MQEETTVLGNPPLLVDLKTKIPMMNQTFKSLANFILDNFAEMDSIPGPVLAQKCNVSEASISRFVKQIGYASYREFQLEIARQNVKGEKSPEFGYSMILDEDSNETVCKKIIYSNIQALQDTLSILDVKTIGIVAGLILKARQVVIFVQGRSIVPSSSLKQRLCRLGILCSIESDPHNQAVISTSLSKNDLVIGISTFGKSKGVIKSLKNSKEIGCPVVGITCYQGGPIERYSDYLIRAKDNEIITFGNEPSGATIAEIAVLDCLYMMVYRQMKEKAANLFQKSFAALEEERCW